MTHQWDEFAKSLADETLPRRESLRLLGAALAGAFLSPLGLGTAWGGGSDPCRAFCQCVNRKQQNDCLATCRACNNDPSRMCGSCYRYGCCAPGTTCCGYEANSCHDLASDDYNCGACGNACDEAGPYEYGACVDGGCFYDCVDGAIRCDGTCTGVLWDPNNCGACGNVCFSPLAPHCNYGECSKCAGGLTDCGLLIGCVDLDNDISNCGACGNACGNFQSCVAGKCEFAQPPGESW